MIYFILNKELNHVKIGYSNNPSKRLKQLQTSHSHKLELLVEIEGNISLEKRFHNIFQNSHIINEWFTYNDEIVDFVEYVDIIKRTLNAFNSENSTEYGINDLGTHPFEVYQDLAEFSNDVLLKIIKTWIITNVIFGNIPRPDESSDRYDFMNIDYHPDDLHEVRYWLINEIYFEKIDYKTLSKYSN